MNESVPDNKEGHEQDPGPGSVAGIEKRFLRLAFWQTILSVAGVFTGAVALYAALTESQAVRQQTAASVWPYVQLMISDSNVEGSASFALSVNNVGVGPARMRGMHLTLNGESIPDWQSLFHALMEDAVDPRPEYGKTSVSRRVLSPGESVVAMQTEDSALALEIQNAVYHGDVNLAYCYCSIFDECWLASSSSEGGEDALEVVKQCPDYGEGEFRD